jgi:sec-independent protein translocase protein TatA
MGLSPTHLLIVFMIIVLLFGGKKVPELMKGLGKGMREFKKAQDGDDDEPSKKG